MCLLLVLSLSFPGKFFLCQNYMRDPTTVTYRCEYVRCYWLILQMLCSFQPSCMQLSTTIQSTASADIKAVGTGHDRGIETEVLGPLRIWHVVAIIMAVLTAVVVIVCCCCNFRVPRTRQQIQENYYKRMMNKEYLRILERSPEELLKRPQGNHRWWEKTAGHRVANKDVFTSVHAIASSIGKGKSAVSVTETSGKLQQSKTSSSPSKSITEHRHAVSQTAAKTSYITVSNEGAVRKINSDITGYSPVERPRPRAGVQIPLAMHPRDIMSFMSRKTPLAK